MAERGHYYWFFHVGSGLENHGKYGELIYGHSGNSLFVNLFIPSVLDWKEKGIVLTQHTRFPEGENTSLTLKLKKEKRFDIHLRYPSWIQEGTMKCYINGREQSLGKVYNGYVSLNRIWKSGDVIKLELPMHTTAAFLPDSSQWVAFSKGPIVLAAEIDTLPQPNLFADGDRMGHIANGPLMPLDQAPFLTGDKPSLSTKLLQDKSDPMSFTAPEIIYQQKYKSLKLVPFYRLSEKRYILYWPYTNQDMLAEHLKSTKLIQAEKARVEAITVDLINVGEQQPETDHQLKGVETESGIFRERHFRAAGKWFSYKMKNTQREAKTIALTLYGAEPERSFSILVNNKILKSVKSSSTKEKGFYVMSIDLPTELASQELEVKFQADAGSFVPKIFEVRLLK